VTGRNRAAIRISYNPNCSLSSPFLKREKVLQLELFTDRLPKRPYCKDEKDAPNLIRLSRHAIRRRYIQINPPNLRFWMPFDIDREGAALAWEDADLPPPNWAATNPANGHAHVAWALSAPVLSGDGSRDAPLRYLCGIEYAYREKMQADHGFNGLIVKNPAHAHWRTLWGPAVTYELSVLAEYVDLPKFIPKRKPEEIGLGRNCSVFDWLRLCFIMLSFRRESVYSEVAVWGV
jgi:hypothetical protein